MAPHAQLRASRYFAALLVIMAGLYALVFLTGGGKAVPKLGLDLKGGTSMVLRATTPDGKAPTRSSLETARGIIDDRVNATGVAEPEVFIEGDKNIVVNVAGRPEELEKVGETAELRFREVVKETADAPGAAASPSASASASGSAKPTTATPTTATPTTAAPTTAAPTTAAPTTAAPTTAAPTTPAPAPSGTAPPVDPSTEALLNQVYQKIGSKLPAENRGTGKTPLEWGKSFVGQTTQIEDPAQLVQNPAIMELLRPFSELTPEEVAVLPAATQYNVPTITCKQLLARPAGSVVDPKAQVVACNEEGNTKYLLKEARVLGTDVRSSDFAVDDQGGGWKVTLQFKGGGQEKWTSLTKDTVNKKVAIVLDNTIVSAPNITSVIPGDAEITGGFDRESAQALSAQLKYGALPLTFEQQSVSAVTPTLGLQQLQAGMLAGLIGIALVIVYCLFYYRALGFVVIASLVVSAAIIYASIVLLGRYMGFTLTLAGIAGFIVAIGITADSFVVFFERLKDEVKDGRTVRSAVPRAWVRARRTILSANGVAFLGAAVLYVLAAGAVKGFAFTLGLSTIVDLLIVFLFTHPLVAVLSRSRMFTSPRVSGLGNLRPDAGAVETRKGRTRTKEA